MSETVKTLVESLLMIGAISGGLVWYAIVAGRREDREAGLSRHGARAGTAPTLKFTGKRIQGRHDPDAHLGRSGTE